MDMAANGSSMTNGSSVMIYTYTTPRLAAFANAFLEPSSIISVIAASFGIIFNIMNIIVLSHPKMRNSVNLLLTMLAASQIVLLIFYIPYVVIFNFNADVKLERFHTTSIHEARFMSLHNYVSVPMQLSASWLIITTACFRFIYVQLPLKSAQLCSYRRAIIAGSCTIATCILVSIPNIVLYRVVDVCQIYFYEACANNQSIYTLYANENYGIALGKFNFWLFAVFGKFIPSILLLFFTIFLIKVLREANQRKKRLHSDAGINRNNVQSSSAPTNEHAQTARMLLAVVILFFLIEFPHGLLLIYSAVNDEYLTYGYLGEVIDLATVIAFSCNLILYSAMSRQYRKLFIEIFISKPVNKLRLTKFSAKYRKCSCSGTSHNAACSPVKAEMCALSVNHDVHTVHSVVPSDESLNLIDAKHKGYVNS